MFIFCQFLCRSRSDRPASCSRTLVMAHVSTFASYILARQLTPAGHVPVLVLYVYFRSAAARVPLTSFPMVSTVVAGRLFRTMVQRLSYCPIHKNSPIFGWYDTCSPFPWTGHSCEIALQGQGRRSLHRWQLPLGQRQRRAEAQVCPAFLLPSQTEHRPRTTTHGVRPRGVVLYVSRLLSSEYTIVTDSLGAYRGGSRHGGRRRSESTCIPANSRTTYAHSSLYDSRELANSNIAP